MANERLRRAIHEAGLQIEDVAEHVEIDVKTAERWITKGRLPHARNRARTAQLLHVDEVDLWPEVTDERRGRGDQELVRLYSHRGDVPHERWYELLERARQEVDVLVYAGLFLADGRSDLSELVQRKARDGVRVRLLYGDPGSEAVAVRGAEEGIGEGLAARIRLALGYMREAFEEPNVTVRLHATTLYNSIYRYDDELLVNAHAFGVAARQSPVLQLRRSDGGELFNYYMTSFERVWDSARPLRTNRAELTVNA